MCIHTRLESNPGLEDGIRVQPQFQRCLSINAFFFLPEISGVPSGDLLTFRDCAEILQSGVTDSGVYVIRLPNSTQTVKVVAALSRSLTFSRKYHLTDCDTKYIFFFTGIIPLLHRASPLPC